MNAQSSWQSDRWKRYQLNEYSTSSVEFNHQDYYKSFETKSNKMLFSPRQIENVSMEKFDKKRQKRLSTRKIEKCIIWMSDLESGSEGNVIWKSISFSFCATIKFHHTFMLVLTVFLSINAHLLFLCIQSIQFLKQPAKCTKLQNKIHFCSRWMVIDVLVKSFSQYLLIVSFGWFFYYKFC